MLPAGFPFHQFNGIVKPKYLCNSFAYTINKMQIHLLFWFHFASHSMYHQIKLNWKVFDEHYTFNISSLSNLGPYNNDFLPQHQVNTINLCLLCSHILLVLRDHGVYMYVVYIWKWSSAHALGGVSGVASFISTDEQLQ